MDYPNGNVLQDALSELARVQLGILTSLEDVSSLLERGVGQYEKVQRVLHALLRSGVGVRDTQTRLTSALYQGTLPPLLDQPKHFNLYSIVAAVVREHTLLYTHPIRFASFPVYKVAVGDPLFFDHVVTLLLDQARQEALPDTRITVESAYKAHSFRVSVHYWAMSNVGHLAQYVRDGVASQNGEMGSESSYTAGTTHWFELQEGRGNA